MGKILLAIALTLSAGLILPSEPIITSKPDLLVNIWLETDSVPVPQTVDTFKQLIESIIWVESRDKDDAYCESEDAVGCLQIRKCMVDDVNRILRGNYYQYEDRWHRNCSIEMFLIYVDYYDLTEPESIARCWNGGPSGDRKSSTLKYWNLVSNYYIELNS